MRVHQKYDRDAENLRHPSHVEVYSFTGMPHGIVFSLCGMLKCKFRLQIAACSTAVYNMLLTLKQTELVLQLHFCLQLVMSLEAGSLSIDLLSQPHQPLQWSRCDFCNCDCCS